MKNQLLITLALLAAGFVGCSSCDSNKPDVQKPLNPDAMLNINVRNSLRVTDTNPNHLTPAEIVDKATHMLYVNGRSHNQAEFWLHDQYKDRPNARFQFWGEFVVDKRNKRDKDGIETPEREYYISPDLVQARGVVFVIEKGEAKDTIAYIPQKVLDDTYKLIEEAFNRGDYDTCYKLFSDAYTAIPITAAEYRELKEKGLN